jgi:hypothetical protein
MFFGQHAIAACPKFVVVFQTYPASWHTITWPSFGPILGYRAARKLGFYADHRLHRITPLTVPISRLKMRRGTRTSQAKSAQVSMRVSTIEM